MVRAQNGRTLFRFFFYILSTASLVKIGGGSVLLNLSLSFLLSLSPPRAESTKMKKTPSEENSLPLPLVCVCECVCVCVCVCSFKNLTLTSECALLRVKEKKENKEEFSDMSEPKRTKEYITPSE